MRTKMNKELSNYLKEHKAFYEDTDVDTKFSERLLDEQGNYKPQRVGTFNFTTKNGRYYQEGCLDECLIVFHQPLV